MSKKLKEENTENVLSEFVYYWDEWHKKWYEIVITSLPNHIVIKDNWFLPRKAPNMPELKEILQKSHIDYKGFKLQNLKDEIQKNWGKLTSASKKLYYKKYKIVETGYRLKNKGIAKPLPIHMALPEPYWISKKILNGGTPRAVFFNINPGPNKFYHLIDSSIHKSNAKYNQDEVWEHDANNKLHTHNWSKVYYDPLVTKKPKKYSEFINTLIKTYSKEDKFWHVEKRVKWVNEIKTDLPLCTLEDIANFEYFPFHTNKAKEIDEAWIDKEKHKKYLLDTAIHLCQKVETLELKNKIISRGNWSKGWKSYFEQLSKEYKSWKISEKRIIVYPLWNEDGNKGSTPYTLNICYESLANENYIFFLNFDGGGSNAQQMRIPSIGPDESETCKSVCFIENEGHEYESVYFDKFMKNIKDYILKQI